MMAQRRRKVSARRKPKRVGRPSKLTKNVEETLCAALRAGNYIDTACDYAGIDRSTFYRWRKLAEEPGATEPLKRFGAAIRKAEADAEVYALGVVKQAMPTSWQAAMTFLERRYPHKWRRRDVQEVTGAEGGPVKVSLQELADPETRKVLGDLIERVGAARAARDRGGTRR